MLTPYDSLFQELSRVLYLGRTQEIHEFKIRRTNTGLTISIYFQFEDKFLQGAPFIDSQAARALVLDLRDQLRVQIPEADLDAFFVYHNQRSWTDYSDRLNGYSFRLCQHCHDLQLLQEHQIAFQEDGTRVIQCKKCIQRAAVRALSFHLPNVLIHLVETLC